MATKTLIPPSASLPLLAPLQDSAASSRIGAEVMRNALYGKWCNVLGHSMTRETKTASSELLELKKGKLSSIKPAMNLIFDCITTLL